MNYKRTLQVYLAEVVLVMVLVSPALAVWDIPTEGVGQIGTWDPVSRTYTLTADVYETIAIIEDNLTLDGAGHTVTLSWLYGGRGSGVFACSVDGVTVKNVNFKNCVEGIWFQHSTNCTFTDSIADDTCVPILLWDCTDCTVTGNSSSETCDGIILERCSNCTVSESTAAANQAFVLSDCVNCTLIDNTVPGAWQGFFISTSHGCTLVGNTINWTVSEGIIIEDSTSCTVTGTTASCEGPPILLEHCFDCTVTGNTVSSSFAQGVILWHSPACTVTDNAVTGAQGIDIGLSPGCTVAGNSIVDTFYVSLCLLWSEDSTVAENTVTNGVGIEISGSDNCTVNGNTASNNYFWGIFLSGSNGCSVADNTFSENETGILLENSALCTVTFNRVSNNETGILLDDSCGSEIYNNNFIGNDLSIEVLSGSYVFNLDAPVGGNYWSNWAPPAHPDGDGDGFVDEPYIFDGGRDDLPLAAIYTFTEEGAGVEVVPEDAGTGTNPVSLSFEQVTASGGTSLTISSSGEDPPAGFELAGNYYYISTTASYTGAITICIEYDDAGMAEALEGALKLYHFENGLWIVVTVPPVDTVNNIICGTVGSLSPFAVFLNPCELPLELIQGVINLGLQPGIENSLISKLENAAKKLDDQNVGAAVNALKAFINEVEAQRGKKIPAGEADDLIDAAQWIIGLVSG